jgi:hypothetical protein
MKVAPRDSFGITSGLLRTFANVGMVFSFAVAILVASTSISRHVAFSIFVGTSTLSASTVAPFIVGLHAAFYSSTSLMVLAGVLSAVRARPSRFRESDAADASATGPTSARQPPDLRRGRSWWRNLSAGLDRAHDTDVPDLWFHRSWYSQRGPGKTGRQDEPADRTRRRAAEILVGATGGPYVTSHTSD